MHDLRTNKTYQDLHCFIGNPCLEISFAVAARLVVVFKQLIMNAHE